jgi:tetratricopeptide (TPR) repeat protein
VLTALVLLVMTSLAALGRQDVVDPALKAAVDRFFATQEAEDVDGYLALWSASAQRPRPEMLKYVFESGDDKYSDVTIVRAVPAGDRMRVRVTATRERLDSSRPDRPPVMRHIDMTVSLTFVREGGGWKLVREGSPVDDLAASVLDASSPEAREALLTADADLVDARLVNAIASNAAQLAQRQVYAAAQGAYERALEIARRIADRKLEGEMLQNLANTHYFQRHFPEAVEAYEQRLVIERVRQDDEGIAAALGGMATVRYSLAEYGEALKQHREALALQERLGDEAAIATTLISTGNILYLQGDYDAAVADYRRSRDINNRIRNTLGEAGAFAGLGRVYAAQGDLAGALEAFNGVLAEGRARNDSATRGSAAMSLGEVHFRLGNLEAAKASFAESRTSYETTGDAANVGRVWQDTALTDLVGGSFAAAEQEYRQSAAACGKAADRECVAAATVGLAFAMTAQDKFTDAIAAYGKAIEAFTTLERPEPKARAEVGLSQALAGAGELEKARAAAVRARSTAEAIRNDDVLWRALTAEARVLRKIKSTEEALAAARAAIAAVERLRDVALARPGTPVAADSVSAYALLVVMQAEAGDGNAAFETSEHLRVHRLWTALAAHERDFARGTTAAERDEERTASVEIATLQAQLTRERNLPHPDPTRVERLERGVADAVSKRALQQRALYERHPDLRIWRGLMPPASVADLQPLLADGGALLDVVVDDEDVVAMAAWQGESGVTIVQNVTAMSRRALAETAGRLLQRNALQDVAQWRRASAEITRLLPARFVDKVASVPRLLVLPDAMLWRVPFDALPLGSSYVADSAIVTYAASVSALVRPPHTTSSGEAPMAVAAPDLPQSVRDHIARTAPDWTLRAPEAAEAEARFVWPDDGATDDLLIGKDATEAAFRARMPRAGWIFVGAPFRVNGASPLYSSILLAPGAAPSNDANDGLFEAREVLGLDLAARVAVMSDRAALSMRDAADDSGVVQWAWRTAGTPAVILPRWDTDEPGPSALLRELSRSLRAGDDPATALHTAAKAIRAGADTAAPWFWSGWFLIGGR